MGDIEFRGKSVKTGKWAYGDLQHNEVGDTWISNLHTFANQGSFENVVRESVGRFIGIESGNKTKIFSGDIIKHNETRFIVKWSKKMFCYICLDPDNKTLSGLPNWRDLPWLDRVKKHIKIIGNIHDKDVDKELIWQE